ncbi:sulfhydrogenase subunit delta [Legionella worsleiensis]|uniref:Sulfhydrogenase subunit delta n=1 Tax=Legionella worsleiensis TaxID=45076 RepID=A0A0W1AA99_9GAMM|nr:sulfhydrogenase subunit delta [Legionella worsleiensis]KTD78282.1 sulfhydrogenase subunit delta [Legionella worsleiensis]STY32619.1 sulfhydrogenase subunit delta [Legionella worsleiensis]
MKARIAVHKFTSCDGCQLAFLNAGEALLTLAEMVDIVNFAEAGVINVDAAVDIAFVEGSISTPQEQERIKKIREQSKYLITLGSCATAGGIQALRNGADVKEWMAHVYASPEHIATLSTSTPVSQHVRVDWELWGCPVNGKQVLEAIRFLLSHAAPRIKKDSECMECKRRGNVCVLITKKQPCMGPVTQLGCGSLCPALGRACYACYGPKENTNTTSLGGLFESWGMDKEAVARLFLHINNQAPAFKSAGNFFKGIRIVHE